MSNMTGNPKTTAMIVCGAKMTEVAFESLQKPLQFCCTENCAFKLSILKAKVAELADAPDLGSGG
jgi:hypothetical protein